MLRYNRDHESCMCLIFRELSATGLVVHVRRIMRYSQSVKVSRL